MTLSCDVIRVAFMEMVNTTIHPSMCGSSNSKYKLTARQNGDVMCIYGQKFVDNQTRADLSCTCRGRSQNKIMRIKHMFLQSTDVSFVRFIRMTSRFLKYVSYWLPSCSRPLQPTNRLVSASVGNEISQRHQQIF